MEHKNNIPSGGKRFGKVARTAAALIAAAIMFGVSLVVISNYPAPGKSPGAMNGTEKAIREIFPTAGKIEKIEDGTVFKVTDISGKIAGYALIAEGRGYQGTIRVLAGVSPDLTKMTGIEILESREMPGIGEEIRKDRFKGQFKGLSVERPIEYVKNRKPDGPGQIQAITGATISSKAVVDAINSKIESLKGSGKIK